MADEPVGRPSRDLETAWFRHGSAALAPIVLLHEGLGSLALWRDLPQRLSARTGRHVFAYSRVGNGNSPPLTEKRKPSYMHDEALRVLPQVLDDQGIERAVLWGHSDGASIAILFAGVFPERVAGAILEAPHLFVEDVSVRSIAAIRARYESSDLRERVGRYHRDGDRTFYGWNDIWLDPAFRSWDVSAYARRIRAPILALQGLDDEYGTTEQIHALARAIPHPIGIELLQACGHAPHVDCPDAVLEAVRRFVRVLS